MFSMFSDIEMTERPPGVLGRQVQIVDNVIRIICALILWVTLFSMLFPTCLNAGLRYLTDSSLVWSEQLVNFLFPWFVMAGAAFAAQHSRHIGVELLPAILGEGRLLGKLRILVHLGIVAACAVIVWYGYEITMFETNTMFTLIGVSQAWSYLAILVGYTLIGLTSLTGVYRLLYTKDLPADTPTSVA